MGQMQQDLWEYTPRNGGNGKQPYATFAKPGHMANIVHDMACVAMKKTILGGSQAGNLSPVLSSRSRRRLDVTSLAEVVSL
jgi:hypothetical protein